MFEPVSNTEEAKLYNESFHEIYDVIVVGYGFGGAVAAIEAADSGAKVLLCEKMPQPGGVSICSGGAVRCAEDPEDAFKYLKATNSGTTPDDVLRVLAEGMTQAEEYVKKLVAVVDGVSIKDTEFSGKRGGNYPFPGWETFYHTQVEVPESFDRLKYFPHVRTRPSSGGPGMFWVLDHNIKSRDITVKLSSPVKNLVRNNEGEVCGLTISEDAKELRVGARQGVVLACGGFEYNHEMKSQYWEGKPVLTASSRGNTGDGIRMAQSVGADLWHMWHFHGCYAFKHPDPDFPFALRVKRLPDWNPINKNEADVKMVWIVVDQLGRRYMNECPPYAQDTSHRPMHYMDSETMSYPRIPSWLITDQDGSSTYQIGDIRTNDPEYTYDWSEDNSQELKLGILKEAKNLNDLADQLEVDRKILNSTVDRWNALCDEGEDVDFKRPPGTMARIDKAPYIFGQVWPAVSNTQGGPVHNAKQQILNIEGKPLPRLYAAGELGSSFGHLYLSGGNIAECFVTGWIAGREVTNLQNLENL